MRVNGLFSRFTGNIHGMAIGMNDMGRSIDAALGNGHMTAPEDQITPLKFLPVITDIDRLADRRGLHVRIAQTPLLRHQHGKLDKA